MGICPHCKLRVRVPPAEEALDALEEIPDSGSNHVQTASSSKARRPRPDDDLEVVEEVEEVEWEEVAEPDRDRKREADDRTSRPRSSGVQEDEPRRRSRRRDDDDDDDEPPRRRRRRRRREYDDSPRDYSRQSSPSGPFDGMFANTNVLLLCLFGCLCSGIALIFGIIGLITCKDREAWRNALTLTIVAVLVTVIATAVQLAVGMRGGGLGPPRMGPQPRWNQPGR
jgi:hypothetical protein